MGIMRNKKEDGILTVLLLILILFIVWPLLSLLIYYQLAPTSIFDQVHIVPLSIQLPVTPWL
jgi:hypothetical protein